MLRKTYRTLIDRLKPIRTKGDYNTIENHSKLGKKFLISICGNNNSIKIGKNCLLTISFIQMSGNANHLIIEDNVRFMGPCKIIMNGNSTLHIKWNAGIRGVEFNLNNANIEVGKLCMFSYGITLRNHDSHKILNPATKEILNPAKDIILGDHVWIAQNATILKGCQIGKDSIIGFGAIVTKNCPQGSIMTGVPAKVVKTGINWDY